MKKERKKEKKNTLFVFSANFDSSRLSQTKAYVNHYCSHFDPKGKNEFG